MQIDLFKPEELKTGAKKSEGKLMREQMLREQQYQGRKAESTKLQKQWNNGRNGRRQEEEDRREKTRQINLQAPQTIVLVSCVSQKQNEACAAKDLYVSDWFKKARAYAEKTGDSWFILSARYGLISPDEIIEPYNQTLIGQRRQEREAWAGRVASKLRGHVPPKSRIVILAGEIYRESLLPLIREQYDISIPLEGLGIGQQKQQLIKLLGE